MTRLRVFAAALSALVPTAFSGAAIAQSWPVRPVRVIIGYAAGGPTDILARMLSKRLQDRFGQPFVVETKPGAGATIANAEVARAPADGYTLTMGNIVFVGPIFHANLGYDIRRDFVMISGLYKSSYVLAVPSTTPVRSVPQLIEWARSNPGKLNYAAGSNSSSLMMEMLKAQGRFDMLPVAYKGNAPALQAMITNEVQAGFDLLGTFKAAVDSGKLRVIAVTSETRMASMPEVPTIAEAGFPKSSVTSNTMMWARSGIPAEVVTRLNTAMREILKLPEFLERWKVDNSEPFIASPQEITEQVEKNIVFWSEAAGLANYRPDSPR